MMQQLQQCVIVCHEASKARQKAGRGEGAVNISYQQVKDENTLDVAQRCKGPACLV